MLVFGGVSRFNNIHSPPLKEENSYSKFSLHDKKVVSDHEKPGDFFIRKQRSSNGNPRTHLGGGSKLMPMLPVILKDFP